MGTKSFTFNSRYLQNFHVVEERQGNIIRFPHTDQLPKLLRALDFEFCAGLPHWLSGIDGRAQDYKKIQLNRAALTFCTYFNRARQDGIRLHPAVDRNKVTRIAIAQHIVEIHDEGALHRFKFYAGNDFFTEVFLNGKRIVFSDHALNRFSERAQSLFGPNMTNILVAFFGSPAVLMECNSTAAFVFRYANTVIAFLVRISDSAPEYFFPTCLAAEQINDLIPIHPPVVFPMQYNRDDKIPKIRNCDTIKRQAALYYAWERRRTTRPEQPKEVPKMSWSEMAHRIIDKEEFGPGSRLLFLDNIQGPITIALQPNEAELKYDALAELKRMEPNRDWDDIDREQKAANPEWYLSCHG